MLNLKPPHSYSTHPTGRAYARFLVFTARTGLIGKDSNGST